MFGRVVDLADLGKFMITWHSQRPNIAYSETKLFDKYFEQLFKRDYRPENIHALNFWMREILKRWTKENPLGMNESLLAMRASAPFRHLYAVSLCFCVANRMAEGVPSPVVTLEKAQVGGIVHQVVDMAGSCLNTALEAAANEPLPANRVFSPQNWIKPPRTGAETVIVQGRKFLWIILATHEPQGWNNPTNTADSALIGC